MLNAMNKLRFYLALWAAKGSILALKLFGKNASSFPGNLALKICPGFNALAPKAPKVIAVTGTNGKTTVTNMTAEMLRALGYRVRCNAMGANIGSGIATLLIGSMNLLGKVRDTDVQVMEVDERYSRLILPAVRPDLLAVTGIFRDSLKRNAHPEYIFSVINDYTPAKTRLVLNADELCSAQLRPANERRYFGIGPLADDVTAPYNLIADHTLCPRCHAALEFDYLRYHHIGHAHCPACGFASPEADYFVERIDGTARELHVRMDGENRVFPLISPILFNVYNELAVIALLREFGIESEAIAEAMGKLMACGAVNNSRKNFYRNRSVAAFTWGTRELYDFINDNPMVELMPVRYVNDPFNIAKNENLVSVNTALEIDLTGQVCSETINGKQYSGTGGASDFAYGAYHAPGGRGVIALQSTAKSGTLSRIVPQLSAGNVVSISRNIVDHIVTEYGVARLRGKSVRDRALALIEIAHPDFREELRQQARKLRLI